MIGETIAWMDVTYRSIIRNGLCPGHAPRHLDLFSEVERNPLPNQYFHYSIVAIKVAKSIWLLLRRRGGEAPRG